MYVSKEIRMEESECRRVGTGGERVQKEWGTDGLVKVE